MCVVPTCGLGTECTIFLALVVMPVTPRHAAGQYFWLGVRLVMV